MKNIELSDEDYKNLIELVEEMKTQENDGQASPKFWCPRSEHMVPDYHKENEAVVYEDGSKSTFRELYDYERENETDLFELFHDSSYCGDGEYDVDKWSHFLEVNEDDFDYNIFYEKPEMKSEQNFSLFKSDVKGFIKHNAHHLEAKPHTYANTIWRMPKMIKLIGILERIGDGTK